MPDIMSLFACLRPCLDATTRRQLCRVTDALRSMMGRITMRGMARWTDKGGSYRTVQRLFHTALNWGTWPWVLLRHHLLAPDAVILTAGDHVVVTKSGQPTDG
jgi:DDE superfamily endonuclease